MNKNNLSYVAFNDLIYKIADDEGWVEPIVKLVEEYEASTEENNLHMVLEDDNIEDRFIWWTSGFTAAKEDAAGNDIICLMQQMTMEQRRLLCSSFLCDSRDFTSVIEEAANMLEACDISSRSIEDYLKRKGLIWPEGAIVEMRFGKFGYRETEDGQFVEMCDMKEVMEAGDA